MDLSGDLDYWLYLVTANGLDLFLFMSYGTFPLPVEKATTFACLPVTPGYWLFLTEQLTLAVPNWYLTISSNWVLGIKCAPLPGMQTLSVVCNDKFTLLKTFFWCVWGFFWTTVHSSPK